MRPELIITGYGWPHKIAFVWMAQPRRVVALGIGIARAGWTARRGAITL